LGKSFKIKVCGLRDPGNIEQVCELEPDLVGYIFFGGSKRFIGNNPDPAIFRIPGPQISKVGVFVDEEISAVRQLFEEFRLDMVQLHGRETVEYCSLLKGYGIPVIKAIDPGSAVGEKKPGGKMIGGISQGFLKEVEYFLFDTPGPGFGGSGEKFDWSLLDRYRMNVPFLLSGGIGPEDAKAVSDFSHNSFFGVDVNSRFELSPGMKDIKLLEKFISEINN